MAGRSREKIWVVRQGDGRTAADIVGRAGEPASAIAEGRVFVGAKRVTRADHPVRTGDTVRIGAGRRADARETDPEVEILFDEDGLVACVKPAGLPTVPDRAGGAHALVSIVAKAVGASPPNDLRVTSRLDRDVSGVVVFARGAAAESRLRAARAEGRYQRRYVALAMAAPALADEGIWDAAIGRAPSPYLRAARGLDAKEAATRWTKVATAHASGSVAPSSGAAGHARIGVTGALDVALLGIDPVTGRTHQIRVHASDAGAPLLGDRDYGGPTRMVLANGSVLAIARVALHAARVVVPGSRGPVEARAPVPAELTRLWAALGGAPDAWDRALACATPGAPR